MRASSLHSHMQWVSVLPSGPLGDVVSECGAHAGVDMSEAVRVDGGEVGTFYVLPELKSVHYQRRHSAFALHEPASLNWKKARIKSGRTYLHTLLIVV